jgi:aldehyde:ferredoxin oxidoreductase
MGFMGKILRVNLTTGETTFEPLDLDRARAFIGGRGLGISYLLEEVDPACEPLSADNKLILMTGPLTGTSAPTGSRYMVMTKSPLTNALTCSNSGGHFGHVLKRTGIDGVIVEGESSKPVYLWVTEDSAEIRDAGHLWGKSVHETTDRLLEETTPKARVACIGPAGENLVRFASIMNEKDRAAGRSGVGAVMGAKKLKAIVAQGSKVVPYHDADGFKKVASEYLGGFKETYKDSQPPLREFGTAVTVVGTQGVGIFPTRNFQQGRFEHWKEISGETLTEKYLRRPKACFACPIACGRVTEIPEGPYKGEGEGPEYETVYSLGSDCGVGDLAALTKANYICNELGMDTISMGATVASAMEMYEKGILSEKETGRPLLFGDADGLIELCTQTAHRQGFGDKLAEGSLRMCAGYGHPEFAMVAKGQEFAGYDPRGEKGMGLVYATSPIGASHMRGDTAYIELLGVPSTSLTDPLAWEDKPQLVKDFQDVFSVIDSAGLCVFFSVRNYVTPTRDIRPEGILRLLNAATGFDYDMDSLMAAAERGLNAERLFLVRAGFSAADDTLPQRIVAEPMPEGPAKGHVCELDKMLPPYYALRGWDEHGRPTAETLRVLALDQY